MTEPTAVDSKTVVVEQLSSAGMSLIVLFDSGATHSFVSTRLVDQLCRPGRELDRPMHIILLVVREWYLDGGFEHCH